MITKMIEQIVSISLISFSITSGAQTSTTRLLKPVITPDVFGKFSSVIGASLSNDGNYALYLINNPSGTGSTNIQSLNNSWSINLGQVNCKFSNNSGFAIFKNANDSLGILNLSNKTIEYKTGVASFTLPGNGNWFGYNTKTSKTLFAKNIETGKEKSFDNVNSFQFSKEGDMLLTETKDQEGSQSLQLSNLYDSSTRLIWTAVNAVTKASNYTLSKDGERVAFVVDTKQGKSLWYYSFRSNKVEMIADQHSVEADTSLFIAGINFRGFTNDSKNLFIELKEKDRPGPTDGVDVWSYTDGMLQSQQLKELNPKSYLAVLNIANQKINRLAQKGETIISIDDKYAIIAKSTANGIYDEFYWNKGAASSVYLVSLADGTRRLLDDHLAGNIATNAYWLSPAGKFVLYYDADRNNFFSYEISTGTRRNITAACNGLWTQYSKEDIAMGKYMPIFSGNNGRFKNDEAILLYDQCDVYQVDPLAKKPPINLTNGLGRKYNIEFRLAIETPEELFNNGDEIVVTAFSRINKNDGFYKITIGKQQPQILTSQPCIFKGTWDSEWFVPSYPVKAKNANVYLVRRMTVEESPNYFWTTDFKTFNRITDVHPEKNYNWMTSELVNWKLPNGKAEEGILYKPQNFDSSKKYPLVVYYYERLTEGTHGFIAPEASRGELNIPYFVSNGYLVFTPDIHYETGHAGQSVVNTVVSATDVLSKFSYVDAKHIGIEGHSRGGWETNVLITHTNKFAAAVSAAGFCDYVTLYNGVRLLSSGISRQSTYERVYQRIGASLWERPGLYIENSPIFKANNVTTPVLMFANKEDEDVPFEQGVEFFTALRRLGKRTWMLQYDGEGHILSGKPAEDFTLRMKQFFDHYLKDSACPRWMLYGVPASEKGNPDALKLVYEKDPKTGKWLTPKEGGLLTDEEKEKVEALKHRKPITITLK